ncbi:hypothetical protein ACFL2T_00980 [Elusimicrobiota bacterium]
MRHSLEELESLRRNADTGGAEELLLYGKALVRRKCFLHALEPLGHALAQGDEISTHFWLAICFESLKDYRACLPHVRTLARVHNHSSDHLWVARVLGKLKRFRGAAGHVELAAGLEGRSGDRLWLADKLMEACCYETAVSYLEGTRYRNRLGIALLYSGREEEALACFNESLARHDDSVIRLWAAAARSEIKRRSERKKI